MKLPRQVAVAVAVAISFALACSGAHAQTHGQDASSREHAAMHDAQDGEQPAQPKAAARDAKSDEATHPVTDHVPPPAPQHAMTEMSPREMTDAMEMDDTAPVFDAIARNLLRLFGTQFALVALARDGQVEVGAFHGVPGSQELVANYPRPIDDQTHVGRTILRGEVSQIVPIVGNPAVPSLTEQLARRYGYDAQIGAPMMRGGKVVGAIVTARREAVPFDDKSPLITSGIRLGTPALTTRGMRKAEMREVASLITRVVSAPDDEAVINAVKADVVALTSRFPIHTM